MRVEALMRKHNDLVIDGERVVVRCQARKSAARVEDQFCMTLVVLAAPRVNEGVDGKCPGCGTPLAVRYDRREGTFALTPMQ